MNDKDIKWMVVIVFSSLNLAPPHIPLHVGLARLATIVLCTCIVGFTLTTLRGRTSLVVDLMFDQSIFCMRANRQEGT